MLLLIDAGNTRVKWALADEPAVRLGSWSAFGQVEHANMADLPAAWANLRAARIVISNVAGNAMRTSLGQLLSAVPGLDGVPEWFVSQPQCAGLRNAYRDPGQLGCDRFASAIGARALYPDRPLLVATCGTATTVDTVSAEGVFIGGMILPGLGLMASSLARNTAQLPQIAAGLDADGPFANHTDAAIASGCLAAQTGAIEHAAAALAHRYGSAQCVLSGGAAALVSPHLRQPHVRVDNLVLIGLHAVATYPTLPSC
jgi:type III pantothenate kinase